MLAALFAASTSELSTDPRRWSVADAAAWVRSLGFAEHAGAFSEAGVDGKRLTPRSVVKGVCTQSQLGELCAFLGSTDPIAAREQLCDSTISELAETLPLSASQLLSLCRKEDIKTVLGEATRIQAGELDTLMDAVERERAWLGV